MVDMKLERVLSCPVCGSSENDFWEEAYDRLHGVTEQRFEYVKCRACGSLFESLRPTREEIGRYYPSDYGPHAMGHGGSSAWSRLPPFMDRRAKLWAERLVDFPAFRHKIKEIDRYIRPASVVLDFGCGSGRYLDKVKKLGGFGVGMDFSEAALEQVRARGHEALPVEDVSWALLKAKGVDFVRMNHVVEHLFHPGEVLRQICSVMRPGGILYIATPNPAGYSCSRFRSAWFALDCPRHVALIPPEQMKQLLQEIGFRVVEVIPDPHPKDLVRSWAYRRIDQNLMEPRDVTNLASDGLLNLYFAFVLRTALRRGGQTDRYHVVAQKMVNT
jgi:SAM-dependent methyltransferase